MVRMLGAGGSPLHRVRTGLEFAVSGRHDVDDMLAQHARSGPAAGRSARPPTEVGDALAGSYERWDGKGWPGKVAGDAVPVASRIVQLAEYVEVAHRTGGVDGRPRAGGAARRARSSIRPSSTSLCDARRTRSSTGSTRSGPGRR